MLSRGVGRSAGAVDHETDFANVFASNFQRIQQGGAGNDGGAVLVVVEDGNFHRLLQGLLDVEALRRLDIFEVDAAEGRLQKLADLNHFVGIMRVDFDVEDIHAGKAFEQDRLPFHYWFGRQCADVSQPQDCRAISHHSDEVATAGVFERVVRVVVDLHARDCDTGSVGQA